MVPFPISFILKRNRSVRSLVYSIICFVILATNPYFRVECIWSVLSHYWSYTCACLVHTYSMVMLFVLQFPAFFFLFIHFSFHSSLFCAFIVLSIYSLYARWWSCNLSKSLALGLATNTNNYIVVNLLNLFDTNGTYFLSDIFMWVLVPWHMGKHETMREKNEQEQKKKRNNIEKKRIKNKTAIIHNKGYSWQTELMSLNETKNKTK